MLKEKLKLNNGGYAILFTVVIVGIISMITIGLSNTAYKQTVLSSVAKDSTIAFYQADIGSECALYADTKLSMFSDDTKTSGEFDCAGNKLKYVHETGTSLYKLNTENETSPKKCFRIEMTKTVDINGVISTIVSKGYNRCDKSNIRTVERGINVVY